jgi:lysophospholipase L1-like esterase
MDNEDGTWNVVFDDNTEVDISLREVELCSEEVVSGQTAETCSCQFAMLVDGPEGRQVDSAPLQIDTILSASLGEDCPRTPTKEVKRTREAAARPPVSDHWRKRNAVLCFGDSLTEGLVSFSSKLSPYSDQLEWRLHNAFGVGGTPPKIINAGISGESARDMVPRLRRLLTAPRLSDGDDDGRLFDESPDVVLILGGTNDLSRMQPKQITELLLSLHRIAHSAGAITGVLTIPESLNSFSGKETFKDVREEVNKALREFVKDNTDKAVLVDVATAFPQDDEHTHLWTKDGTHFSAKGYEALGDLLAESHFSPC